MLLSSLSFVLVQAVSRQRAAALEALRTVTPDQRVQAFAALARIQLGFLFSLAWGLANELPTSRLPDTMPVGVASASASDLINPDLYRLTISSLLVQPAHISLGSECNQLADILLAVSSADKTSTASAVAKDAATFYALALYLFSTLGDHECIQVIKQKLEVLL